MDELKSDVLIWTPSHRHASADAGCNKENLLYSHDTTIRIHIYAET